MRVKGKISSWNAEKGFGFISPNGGGKPIFIHINAFANRGKPPEINQIVTYRISADKQGRPCAEQVTRAGERLPQKTNKEKRHPSLVFAILFLVFLGMSAGTAKIPLLILPFYCVVSLSAFMLYAFDKAAAQRGGRRTPESTLHLFSLVGGWPGAIFAQQLLRHKSKKQSFRVVFWLTVLLNFGVLIWLHTPAGTDVLQTFISRNF